MRKPVFVVIAIVLQMMIVVKSEPWIDTRDIWLRADIETLSDAGIITVPITTYPLMWSGIIKDIDNTNIESVPAQYKEVFWRVKKAGKAAFSKREVKQTRVSVANQAPVFRSFGDQAREKNELSARRYGLDKNFAWNLEVTRVSDPQDGDKTRFDGSYLSYVIGNWVASVGSAEKWWGPGWQSNSILSNYARTPLGFTLTRNYSEESDLPFLSLLGPWNINLIFAKVDDDEFYLKGTYFSGLTANFKPHQSLEIGLRITSFSKHSDTLIPSIRCFEQVVSEITPCPEEFDETTLKQNIVDRMHGGDIRWRIHTSNPASLYMSHYKIELRLGGGDKTIKQYGITSSLKSLDVNWTWYIEMLDSQSSVTYESSSTKYSFLGDSLGAHYGDASDSFSIGVLGYLDRVNKVNISASRIKMNEGVASMEYDVAESQNSLWANDINIIRMEWSHQLDDANQLSMKINYLSRREHVLSAAKKNYGVSLDWTHSL